MEVLNYRVTLRGLTVGEITLTSTPLSDSLRELRMISISRGILDKIYPMRDTISSIVFANSYITKSYSKRIHEKNYEFSVDVTYDVERGIAHYSDGKSFHTPLNARDALSVIYYIRDNIPEEGKRTYIPYHFDKRSASLPVENLGSTYIKTKWDKRKVSKIAIRQKGENLFRGKGDIILWIGEDGLLYKLQYNTKFGKFTAKLESFNQDP